ncbi:MAG: adenine phosphoribosyltransferase [Myxococcales bacterium]|nr:adenine phosphoribosyltransferase [Myxococcales bacterium]
MSIAELQTLIRDVPDFPKPGILFKDITPLLAQPRGMHACTVALSKVVHASGAEELVGIESRGFIFASAVAAVEEMPLQLVRKPGKLPYEKVGIDYDLEYGSDRVEMHSDAIVAGRRYAIVDDLLATGGTAAATASLIEGQGGIIACAAFVIELSALPGRECLGDRPVHALISY